MKDHRKSDREHRRPVNKANMDAPQEEFIADESMPSHSDHDNDREHGSEVQFAQREYDVQHR